MSALLVTYDLKKPGQNYDDLYDAIKNLGTAWCHYLDSTWIVATNYTVSQAMEKLRNVIDTNDSLLIIDISRDPYTGWLTQEAWDWLAKYV